MLYEIQALRGKEYISLRLEAASAESALGQAKAQGYAAFSARPLNGRGFAWSRRERFPLMLFSQELLALIEAGLNLLEALEALAEKEQRPEVKQVLEGVLRALNEGQPISAAMEKFPLAFPPLYVAAMRASEKTGGVAESLQRYIVYQGQIELVRKKVVSASIYPAMLLIVGGLVIMFLMGYVVPKFSHIYEDVGGELPVLSQWMLAWGGFLDQYGGVFLGVLGGLVFAAGFMLSQASVRARLLEMLWAIPALGERMRIYQLARFYRSLGMLLTGGIPILTALNMVSGLLAPALRARLEAASAHIREGQPISAAMEMNALSTPVALRMLRVGERSGRMGEMMERIAAFYDEETARWIDWFTKLFEPLLMLAIGLVIGLVVLLLYMPIFDLAGSIQ